MTSVRRSPFHVTENPKYTISSALITVCPPMLNESITLARKGKFVIFPDVNLIADVRYAKELFTALIPLKKWWFGLTTTAIGHNDELLDIFEKSGCKGLLLGFESVNQETQTEINKNVNKVNDYKWLMDKLHEHNILVMGCFAFGSDEDGKDVFDRTAKLCLDSMIDLPRFSIITPFPGTAFYKELDEHFDSFEPGKYSYSVIWGNGLEAPKGESDDDDINFSIHIERDSKTFSVVKT